MNEWMNEWMKHLYSALLCIAVHPKRFTIIWGGVSSQPPPVCSIHLDDATAATGQRRQCAHHTPATGGEEREIEPIKWMGIMFITWWPMIIIKTRCCSKSGTHLKEEKQAELWMGVVYKNLAFLRSTMWSKWLHCVYISAAKQLIAINRIQNKSVCLQNICVYCVYLLCIYKYKHMHVYI